MNNKFKISGIHHITAIASSASENLAFYENVLGLQLVKKTVNFDDPHGLSLELIETPTVHSILNQSGNSKSVASRIVGVHSSTALLRSSEETQSLLMNLLGMDLYDTEGNRYRFKMKSGDCFGHFYDVVVDAQAENGRQGGGTVHHIAFRTPTDDEQKYWQKSLKADGFSVTPIRDRKYFK